MNIFSCRNGTGKAQIAAKKPSRTHKPNAFGELYPPMFEKIIPPTTTPDIGAVRHVN